MSSAVIFFIALIVLVVGCFLGWHANRAYFANGDVKSTHGRISGYRKTRMRSGLIAVGILVAALLVVSALARH
jgi:divalent metal cation (Fe/Co/Zn/Cd) transporter